MHMFATVFIFQDGLERVVIFTDSKLLLYFISCDCFILPALLKTYGVCTASALKQVFHVPFFSELLIQTLSQLVSSIYCTPVYSGRLYLFLLLSSSFTTRSLSFVESLD